MARVVSQISPNTILKRTDINGSIEVWASGIKVDKWTSNDGQSYTFKIIKPQLVKTRISTIRSWSNIGRLSIELEDGKLLAWWEANDAGIKFFNTREDAERHFLYYSNNLLNQQNEIIKLHDYLYNEYNEVEPQFIKEFCNDYRS